MCHRLPEMALDRSCADLVRSTIVVQQSEILDLIVSQQWVTAVGPAVRLLRKCDRHVQASKMHIAKSVKKML